MEQPVPSQCPVALSTLRWHLLGSVELPEPLQDMALPCPACQVQGLLLGPRP